MAVGPFHGIWMTRSAPLAYRVMPKCGCSSIGQAMHHLDHGRFHPRSIHDPAAPLLKWSGGPDDAEIAARYAQGPVFTFTMVRNPFRRLLSSFADKIVGLEEDGTRYRAGLLQTGLERYGADWGCRADVARNFRAFVRFVADGLDRGLWDQTDMHWTPCADHLAFTLTRNPALRFDHVGHVERFGEGLATALAGAGLPPDALPTALPRENATRLPDLPVDAFYGPEERAIVLRLFARDFALFRYGSDPSATRPEGPVDAAAVGVALRPAAAPPRLSAGRG